MNNSKTVYVVGAVVVIVLAAMWFNQKTPQVVTASGHPEWQPIMYKNGDVIEGAGPQLVKMIFEGKGIDVKVPYTGAWDEVQAKAKSGEVDVLVAAYKTAEREGYMVYSDPYTTDPIALYVPTGKTFPFASWDELVGKKGVAMVGDSYGQAFDDFIVSKKLDVKRATTSEEAFGLLTSGQADYFIYSLYAGDKEVKQQQLAGKVESLPKFVAEENFYITISKKSPFVKNLADINAGIAKYKADGTIDQLIKDYKNR